ncbi:MAG: ABC transporter permease [Acidobacteria bacterium]|nr:ABC transporter permease [Acidobacteriota bacterium]
MRAPGWARVLVRIAAPRGEAEDVLGDLEESRHRRLQRHGAAAARMLSAIDTLDMVAAIARTRADRFRTNKRSSLVQDYKLGWRMLVKYPGLTLAGGLALAIAIGIGAGWYDLTRDFLRPNLPLPEGHRIVEVEMRNAVASEDERRLLHDFLTWRRDVQSIEELGAYRSIERNLVLGDAQADPVTGAEITASAFRLVRVAPLVGRPLLEADEQPGAEPVAVLGYDLWRQRFGGRTDAIGETIQLGRTTTTVVGVMPEGFTFPINHRFWIPLPLQPSGYAPLEGVAIRVFGRLAPGATQAQANTEVTALVERTAQASPRTHEHLRPRVLAYGGESPGDKTWLELAVTHLPILLVLVVACMNVGTLIYARTATRDAEISMRYALGASRGRIISQLFVEALVLAAIAAVVGLVGANFAVKWGMTAYYAGQGGAMPFWVNPGLKFTTVLYAGLLTVAGAALLGVLPALKVTGTGVQAQLRNLGAGGSTLRFGWGWTTVMIVQVALTVICIPPALGITSEALRDRRIREQFPGERYLAARVGLDREASAAGDEAPDVFAKRLEQTYSEFARRVAEEPDVVAITFGDRMPGMGAAVRRAEFEAAPGAEVLEIASLWTNSVGPGFFEAFEIPLVGGRTFHDGDRVTDARTVMVNEAFARRYVQGGTPVGRRVRYASSDPANPQPWLEIVGVVRDIGMTPTDLGEAPYLFRPVAAATAYPLVMGVRSAGDPAALAPRLRVIAAAVDPGLRLDDLRSVEDLAWRVDVPAMVAAGAITTVVVLGLFLSAAGIFSLMSVSVARRTREIGLRAALGASPARLLRGIFARALILVGSGIAAGNAVLITIVTLSTEVDLATVSSVLAATSAVMLVVGLLACVEPARRALRIQPTDALKEA